MKLSRTARLDLGRERELLRVQIEAIEMVLGENSSLEDFSLRDAIRKVLAESPRGLKPMAVTQKMDESGFTGNIGTKTSLLTRVRNEMWRMAQTGELVSERGVYCPRPRVA